MGIPLGRKCIILYSYMETLGYLEFRTDGLGVLVLGLRMRD